MYFLKALNLLIRPNSFTARYEFLTYDCLRLQPKISLKKFTCVSIRSKPHDHSWKQGPYYCMPKSFGFFAYTSRPFWPGCTQNLQWRTLLLQMTGTRDFTKIRQYSFVFFIQNSISMDFQPNLAIGQWQNVPLTYYLLELFIVFKETVSWKSWRDKAIGC
jgi:hypothetical protein